jgi:hypothetical protein
MNKKRLNRNAKGVYFLNSYLIRHKVSALRYPQLPVVYLNYTCFKRALFGVDNYKDP